MSGAEAMERLKSLLGNDSGVYVPPAVDRAEYVQTVGKDILSHLCEPFAVSATVVAPGFPDEKPGSLISGLCIARTAGYWLVYQSSKDRFLCFWGTNEDSLSAPGIFGSPVYCWTA
jgi:hypothetical protein